MTTLDPHRRGDTFEYSFRLGNGWVGSDFTGGVKFTLRTSPPDSNITTDDDAVDQASVSGGEIVFSGAAGTITIPASRTTEWPAASLFWDLQGVISGTPNVVHTIDDGAIRIKADITRST